MAPIKTLVRKLVSFAGYSLHSAGEYESLAKKLDSVSKLYRERVLDCVSRRKAGAECIVFSCDRALQLHALLASYVEQATNHAPVRVLYRASNEDYQRTYEQLMGLFAGYDIVFVRQESLGSFRRQILELISKVETRALFFLVDDILFANPVDIKEFSEADTNREVSSLRLGLHLKKSYMLNQDQPLPDFMPCGHAASDAVCWLWRKGACDWGYPLSVDGHLFGTDEMFAMASVLDFTSPNSFESNLQLFNPVFLDRQGVCYRTAKIINIPCNKVQADFVNNRSGNISPQYLLEMWNKGLQMDYRSLRGHQGDAVHEELAVHLIPRG